MHNRQITCLFRVYTIRSENYWKKKLYGNQLIQQMTTVTTIQESITDQTQSKTEKKKKEWQEYVSKFINVPSLLNASDLESLFRSAFFLSVCISSVSSRYAQQRPLLLSSVSQFCYSCFTCTQVNKCEWSTLLNIIVHLFFHDQYSPLCNWSANDKPILDTRNLFCDIFEWRIFWYQKQWTQLKNSKQFQNTSSMPVIKERNFGVSTIL